MKHLILTSWYKKSLIMDCEKQDGISPLLNISDFGSVHQTVEDRQKQASAETSLLDK
jgi:hypothetical protein